MGSAGAVRQGRVFVEIGADSKGFFAELQRVNARIGSLGDTLRSVGLGMTAVGAAIAGPIMALGGAFVEQTGEMLAMKRALACGGVAPEQVDYINAHGTATPLGDTVETSAIKEVFGAHAPHLPVSSTKALHGHLLGAAGALETLVLIREFRAGSDAVEQPPLEAAQLLGTWRGQAATISADWPEPDQADAALTVESGADGSLQLTTTIGGVSSACEGRLQLLPDAGYHLSPLQVSHRAPFAVQAGWLPQPGRLECLIRRFDGTGAWQASTQLQLQRV